jgi:ketosteroid isomerase-like protein
MPILVRLLGTVLIVLLAGGAAAQTRASDELLAMPEAWHARYNAGDIDGLAALYAPNATAMAPDLPPAHGREAIAAVARGYLEAGAVRIDVQPSEAYQTGSDAGWGVGTFELFSAEGDPVGMGSYLIVYRLQDGAWRIHRHIWNSDLPPAP